MMRNTKDTWGWMTIALHWTVALLVVATFGLGLWMGEVPARIDRPYYYAIHASMGITLLVILVARIAWAVFNPAPAAVPGTPVWQNTAARFTHVSLYAVTLVVVLLGWLLSGVAEPPIEPQAFGLIAMPSPLTLSSAYEDFLEETHELAAYALIALASVHALAALWHHFIRHDNTMRRMLRSDPGSA